nr:energy-coupling factor transporter transmembrane component T [uncultured Lachnoclostridium sp.]
MNQKKYTMFMRMHPLVNFMYFLVMMLFVMFYVHPVLLGIAGIVCFAYLCYLGGNKQFRTMLTLIPFIMLLSLINPLFNRNGDTVLCYVFHRPITLEASLYGLVAALMIYDMILLFRVFHIIMSSDKIICLFSKMLPIGTLLFTMTLRFVPMYKAQLAKMRLAQKGIQHDVTQGTRIQKIRNGVELISGLITWALENGLESAGERIWFIRKDQLCQYEIYKTGLECVCFRSGISIRTALRKFPSCVSDIVLSSSNVA